MEDVGKSLARQVQVDLELVKGWKSTELLCNKGVYYVTGVFEGGEVHTVVPHLASSVISPKLMDEFYDVSGVDRSCKLVVAFVERDGTVSYFELSPMTYTPPNAPAFYMEAKEKLSVAE